MVQRDPQTGKFVSSGPSLDWSDMKTFSGALMGNIPAADLAGGNTVESATGDEVQLLDFTPLLDNDEVFELYRLDGTVTLHMPTTGTAESSGQMEWSLIGDLGQETGGLNPFYGGGVSSSIGIIDVNTGSSERSAALATGRLTVDASLNDTVNGTAAGAMNGFDRVTVPFIDELGAAPAFDRDDEITAPHSLAVDNVSDHAVSWNLDFLFQGRVRELD